MAVMRLAFHLLIGIPSDNSLFFAEKYTEKDKKYIKFAYNADNNVVDVSN